MGMLANALHTLMPNDICMLDVPLLSLKHVHELAQWEVEGPLGILVSPTSKALT